MRFSEVVGKEKREITKNVIIRIIRSAIGKTYYENKKEYTGVTFFLTYENRNRRKFRPYMLGNFDHQFCQT